MAYTGTTSTAPNVPYLVSQSISGSQRIWRYKSTHTQALAAATGFFTDGQYVGLQVGDEMLVLGSTTYVVSHHTVQAVSSTGATLSAGLLVSSAS
jgi:hypothetical protein